MLEKKAIENHDNVDILKTIVNELNHRSTSRAITLKKHLNDQVNKMTMTTNSQSTNSNTTNLQEGRINLIYPPGFLKENFETLRKKLLNTVDSRSRLLNLDHSRKGTIRTVATLPNTIANLLLTEKSLTFVPVDEPEKNELIDHGYLEFDEEKKEYIELKPYPNAKEWAAIKGISDDYELSKSSIDISKPEENKSSNSIQTLLYPPTLEKSLKDLSRDAKISIEETGNNILFLCLGFLEYSDQSERDGTARKRFAPLFMIPVELERKAIKNIATYSIKHTGEDIISNLTLNEKLSHDFGLYLPNLYSDETLLSPEDYFTHIENLLEQKKNDNNIRYWKVRRFISLATLNLGKLLIYKDLDPELWAKNGKSLLDHKWMSRFFGSETIEYESVKDSLPETYDIDTMPKLQDKFPVVEDADSSQMAALIDALNGEDLVIEGPPGTGKSQTITNLIAAALAQNKTILFVAEKQAALDVVKRRLNNVGLGDFCLDLHSDKVQKSNVLKSFENRIDAQSSYTFSLTDYESIVRQYTQSQEELQTYVKTINEQWKNTGFTIHEILTAATRYANEAEGIDYKEVSPDGLTGENFSIHYLNDQVNELEKFDNYLNLASNQLEETGNWSSHPWYGVNNKTLTEHTIKDILSKWNVSFEMLFSELAKTLEAFKESLEQDIEVYSVWDILNQWNSLPTLNDNEYLPAFKTINKSDLPELQQISSDLKTVGKLYKKLSHTFNREFLIDLEQVDKLLNSLKTLNTLGVPSNLTPYSLIDIVTKLEKLSSLLTELNTNRLMLNQSFSSKTTNIFSPDIAGLNELATFVSLLAELPAEYIKYRQMEYDDVSLDEAITSYQKDLNEVNELQQEIEIFFNLQKLPNPDLLETYSKLASESKSFSFLNKNWRTAKKHINQFVINNDFIFKNSADALFTASKWLRKVESINQCNVYKQAFGTDYQGVDTDIERIISIRTWYKKIRNHYGFGFGRTAPLATAAFECSMENFRGVHTLAQTGLTEQTKKLNVTLNEIAKVFVKESNLSDDRFELKKMNSLLMTIKEKVNFSLNNTQPFLNNPNLTQTELNNAINDIQKLKELIEQIKLANISQRFFENKLDLASPDNGSLPVNYETLSDTINFLSIFYEKTNLKFFHTQLITCESASDYQKLKEARNTLNNIEEQERKNRIEFLKAIEAKLDDWLFGRNPTVSSLITKNKKALDNTNWLDSWSKYLYARERLDLKGFSKLKNYLTNNINGEKHAINAFHFSCYRTIANEIYSSVPLLSQKSGHEQTAIRKKFSQIDNNLKAIQQKRIASLAAQKHIPQGRIGARVSDYTENALLTHEIRKKTRHISIRRLIERAGSTMLAYKPCFMMSPMAVAKYLPAGTLEFDLVVMDEASQIKQEYALSSFVRGKSVVVVGDPKQLPPTNFFERITEDEDNPNKSVIQDSESILEAMSGFTHKRMLRWHYRSRHESLIAFSNHHFYDSKLVVFPSPYALSDEFGIKHHPIDNGYFRQGVNPPESRLVAQAIKEHLLEFPNESLGVVAMNAKQRDQIEKDLETLAAKDPLLANALSFNSDTVEPLFIKNLENVQGDERDVIFISFTYGPLEKGSSSIPQRFGPVNEINGWRRLNVLFTRAKKRKHIFTSMRSGQIIVSESNSKGIAALRDYLKYAETGYLSGSPKVTGKEPDSDFEIAVIDILEQHGYECEPQLGVERYFIDIAVRDPGLPGKYLMGIECDGATYHSAKSTRDRDKVRQMVLEGLGWNIKRIWSTDWFKNPNGEIKPILDELERLSTPVNIKPDDDSKPKEPILSNTPTTPSIQTEKSETLESMLLKFRSKVIAKKFPDTVADERLLRPELLKQLLIYKPINQEEFLELIPMYLRATTSMEEASEFLDTVLEIIAEYVEE